MFLVAASALTPSRSRRCLLDTPAQEEVDVAPCCALISLNRRQHKGRHRVVHWGARKKLGLANLNFEFFDSQITMWRKLY